MYTPDGLDDKRIKRIVSVSGTHKQCKICCDFKPIDDMYFPFCPTTLDRLRNECRKCTSQRVLKRYHTKSRLTDRL